MELLAAVSSSVLLLAGMASSILVAGQALDLDRSGATNRPRQVRAVQRMLGDVREAIAFTERTPTAVAFTVPDRDGDGVVESIRYAWGGESGDPLTKECNGSEPLTVVADVEAFQFEYGAR